MIWQTQNQNSFERQIQGDEDNSSESSFFSCSDDMADSQIMDVAIQTDTNQLQTTDPNFQPFILNNDCVPSNSDIQVNFNHQYENCNEAHTFQLYADGHSISQTQKPHLPSNGSQECHKTSPVTNGCYTQNNDANLEPKDDTNHKQASPDSQHPHYGGVVSKSLKIKYIYLKELKTEFQILIISLK